MNYFSARKYMNKEQAARMGRASQKAQALRRMAEADYDPIPVRPGLQLVVITLDMKKQDGLIGWHDAGREVLGMTRPLLSI